MRAAQVRDGARWLEFDLSRGGGVYESPVVPAGMDFTEAVLSWNVDRSEGVTVVVEARVRASTTPAMIATGREGVWSPWVRMGRVGPVSAEEPEASREWAFGRVDVDVVRSDVPLNALQYRLRVIGFGEASVARVGVVFSASRASLRWASDSWEFSPGRVGRSVPFSSQRVLSGGLDESGCSPTSVAMVLGAFGVDASPDRVAELVRDPDFDLYGNWPRNVQGAYELGVGGYVTRFGSWGPVLEQLRRGRLLVVSIKAGPGELDGAPYETTRGHLLVLRGFDGEGGCLVSDPAAREAGEFVYPISEMERVWMGRGAGTAYVLGVD